MRTVGLITEYNPFHNGHLYHLERSKEITNSKYSIAIMSGNFLQRGEPALVDKWTRAKMAVDNGIDLVIELPTIYACQSAEYFAFGAIKLLDSIGVVDAICFGSEYGSIDLLKQFSDMLIAESEIFKRYLKLSLSEGNPYPKARNYALRKIFENSYYLDSKKIDLILSNPNNILAIEYLKALTKLKSNLTPLTIKRIGGDYNTRQLTGSISSATAIRNILFNYGRVEKIKETVPSFTYTYLMEFIKKYNSFNRMENFNQILLYLLRSNDSVAIQKILDVDEGLNNRILKCSSVNWDIRDILDCIKTKRYTYTRLQRILIHLLIGLNEDTFNELNKHGPLYIRVLGANQNGLEILSEAKKRTTLPIITKFANFKKLKSELLNKMINIDKRATDIYFLGLETNNKTKGNLDYFISPYIKKD